MKVLLQRVTSAEVKVANDLVGHITHGLLVLVGFEAADDSEVLRKMAHKLLHYRVFSDSEGKMNLNLQQVAGSILLVPQFTLVADTDRGLRPSFSRGASPAIGKSLFEDFVAIISREYPRVATGRFGADMQVSLVNDGPVTFALAISAANALLDS